MPHEKINWYYLVNQAAQAQHTLPNKLNFTNQLVMTADLPISSSQNFVSGLLKAPWLHVGGGSAFA